MRRRILRWLFGADLELYDDLIHGWAETNHVGRDLIDECKRTSDAYEQLKNAYEDYTKYLEHRIEELEEQLNGQSRAEKTET